jgi:hypothetical protein
MAKEIAVAPKERGQPATGRDPPITVRLPQQMIDGLESSAGKNNVSRSEAVRDLIGEHFISAPKVRSKTLKVAASSETTALLAPHRLWSKPTAKR